MVSKSKNQFKYIQTLRSKYKTEKDTPKKHDWIWEKDWTDVEYDKLPNKVKNEVIKEYIRKLYKETITDLLSEEDISNNNLNSTWYQRLTQAYEYLDNLTQTIINAPPDLDEYFEYVFKAIIAENIMLKFDDLNSFGNYEFDTNQKEDFIKWTEENYKFFIKQINNFLNTNKKEILSTVWNTALQDNGELLDIQRDYEIFQTDYKQIQADQEEMLAGIDDESEREKQANIIGQQLNDLTSRMNDIKKQLSPEHYTAEIKKAYTNARNFFNQYLDDLK